MSKMYKTFYVLKFIFYVFVENMRQVFIYIKNVSRNKTKTILDKIYDGYNTYYLPILTFDIGYDRYIPSQNYMG